MYIKLLAWLHAGMILMMMDGWYMVGRGKNQHALVTIDFIKETIAHRTVQM
jgi:hypothetical protein